MRNNTYSDQKEILKEKEKTKMRLVNNQVRLLSGVKNGDKGVFAVFRSEDRHQQLVLRHRLQCYTVATLRLYVSVNGKSRVYIENDFQEVLLFSLQDSKKHDIEADADIITTEGVPVFNDTCTVRFKALILAEVPNQAIPFTLLIDYFKQADADPIVHIGKTTERSVIDLWLYQAQFNWDDPVENAGMLLVPQTETNAEGGTNDVSTYSWNRSSY